MSQVNVYPPSEEFVNQANVPGMDAYRKLYQEAADDPDAFWGALAKEHLHWFEPFDQVCNWEAPFASAPQKASGSSAAS